MNTGEARFVKSRSADWGELEVLLESTQRRRLRAGEAWQLSRLFRSICADVSHARGQGFSAARVAYLDTLAARSHRVLYFRPATRFGGLLQWLLRGFPREVRASGWFIAVASALLWLPFLFTLIGTLISPTFGTVFVDAGTLQQASESYATSIVRSGSENAFMSGFYVYNNVGIAFRCFAVGVIPGLGPAWYLVFNGTQMGTTFGWVMREGFGHNIWAFVCGHGFLELTAIAVSGAAGLRLGWTLVRPGPFSRAEALQREAVPLATLIAGAGFMLGVAAMIEGWWSAADVSHGVKAAVGIANTCATLLWLWWGGRR